jgi:hypothetical protein
VTEEKKAWNQEDFNKTMQESSVELTNLRAELQELMVRFGLRALKTYQAARPEPLRPTEVGSLVKYEITNAVTDLMEQNTLDAIIKQAKSEWEKQQSIK